MLNKTQKIAISKNFIISLLFCCLIFTAIGLTIDDSCAAELNQTGSEMIMEANIEDKLGNSQVNEVLEVDKSSNDVLNAPHVVTGRTFQDIQDAINGAQAGDRIYLAGEYTPNGKESTINVTKQLVITSTSSATLNGQNVSGIFKIWGNSQGSGISNIKFINANQEVGSAINIYVKNVLIYNCTFENNHCDRTGVVSSRYNLYDAENLTIRNCLFRNNSAYIKNFENATTAAALGVYGMNTRIINCTFDSNWIKSKGDVFGGAIQIGLDEPNYKGLVYNCTFINNKAITINGSSHGGAGCVRNGVEYYQCKFINNSAGQGGALTFHASGKLKDCIFINNTATILYGGAVSTGFLYDSMELEINNCYFEGNDAPKGGAIQVAGLNVDIINSNFTKNHADTCGGALNIEALNVNIQKSFFGSNIAEEDGGAIYTVGKNTIVDKSSFISNEARPDYAKLDDGLGGAIYINSTKAKITNSNFYYNKARNGSAVYYDKDGNELILKNNTLFENQAWVYLLPIYAHDIYYGQTEEIKSIIYGGNNIAKYNNLAVSNAIYNAADYSKLSIDGESPVNGATNNGRLYQDDREYNMEIILTVKKDDGSVVYNKKLNSNYLGEVSDELNNLEPGKYYVTAKHIEDTYYKAITNTTTFNVIPKVDNQIRKAASDESFNYNDTVVWTLNITNNGPNKATNVTVTDVLPKGLIYIDDDTNNAYNPHTGILYIGDVEVGQTIIVNIYAKINKTGDIVNKANVTSHEFDVNLTNNHDEAKITIPPTCDLAVVKTVNNSNPNYGDLVKWTIVVRNNGPDAAHGVVMSDVLPKSLIFVNSTGSYNNATGKWNIGTLGVNKQVKLEIICRVNATGTIKNTVTVKSNEVDRDESNNKDSSSIKVNKSCDLAIDKLIDVQKANLGDVIVWKLVISNNGPDNATGVKITDVLPDGLIYQNSVLPRGSYSNGVISVGKLAVGERLTYEILSKVNKTGTLINVASIKGNQYDYDLSNNKDNASVYINPASDLIIKKAVNNSNPNYGDLVKWTIVVKNNGPDVAHGVVMSDVLPKSLIYVNSTGSYNNATGKWSIGTLGVNKNVRLEIICRVNATGAIINNASVKGQEFDINESNNWDLSGVKVNKSCDLAIDKLIDVQKANLGDVIVWKLVISNNGPDNATGVKITDVLPVGLIYQNSVLPRGSYSNGVISVGKLAVGERLTYEILSKVNKTGTLINVASIKGNQYDYDLSNNKDNASVYINPASDLEVKKTANVSNPNYNDLIKWTIVVKNNGPDVAHGVVMSDILPKSLIYVNSTGSYNNATGKWSIGTLGVNKQAKLEIICRVNATGTIINNVSVKGQEFDINESNNRDFYSVKVNKSCDLAIEKSINVSKANYGDVVSWKLVISNNGPDNATGVKITDSLPEGFVYMDSRLPRGTYSNGIISVGKLAVGEKLTYEIIGKFIKTGKRINVASIKGNQYDYDLSNNKDNASVYIYPASDLEVKKTVNVSNPNYNELVKWTVVVKNNGPDEAVNVVVSDVLPESLIWVSDDADGKYDHVAGKWNISKLTAGVSVQLNIISRVNATGFIQNNVSVNGDNFDYNLSNNNDSSHVNVSKTADVSVTKFVNSSKPNYGDIIKWTVIARNDGPDKATSVSVDDILPEGLIFIDANASKGIYDNGIWAVCCLEKGEEQTLQIICKVNKTGKITNFATITAEEVDLNPSNNNANKSIKVPSTVDLIVTKQVSDNTPYFGDDITWMISIKNDGPDSATNIVLYDLLDEGLIFKEYSSSIGTFDNDKWTISKLKNGNTAYLNITCTVKKLGEIINEAYANCSQVDRNKSNNNDSETITVSPVTDLAVYKIVDNPNPNYGDVVKWIVMVANNGPNDATGVNVKEIMPSGVEILESSDYIDMDGNWFVGNLSSEEVKELDITCKVISTGKFENTVIVSGNEHDPYLDNNEAVAYIDVPPACDISITKTVSKYTYKVGDIIDYSIKIANNGPDEAVNIKVNEIPDKLLTLKSVSATKGSYDESNQEWDIDYLDNGESAELYIRAMAAGAGIVKNMVQATTDTFDRDLSNNNDSVEVDVDKKDEVPKHDDSNNTPSENNEINEMSLLIGKNHVSGNPFAILAISLLFSMIALRGIFSKKR